MPEANVCDECALHESLRGMPLANATRMSTTNLFEECLWRMLRESLRGLIARRAVIVKDSNCISYSNCLWQ